MFGRGQPTNFEGYQMEEVSLIRHGHDIGSSFLDNAVSHLVRLAIWDSEDLVN